MYSAITVARYIVKYSNSQGVCISNLRLQKLLYFVQAQFLVFSPGHQPCFSDPIVAWDIGPVIPAVYHRYKIFGGAFIPEGYCEDSLPDEEITPEDQERINLILRETTQYNNSKLLELVHGQTPWRKAYVPGRENVITNQSIREFFTDEEKQS